MLIKLNKQSFLLISIFIFISIFSIQRFFLINGCLETFSSYLFYPFIKIQGNISESLKKYYKKKETIELLNKKIIELKKENEELFFDNVRMKSAIGYLEQISELIEFKKKINNSFITCQIIHKQFSNQAHIAYIDKGSNDNVTKNMVVVYKNCLIGRVDQVYPTYSKIIFLSDRSCKIAAYCYKTGALGIYEGQNNLQEAELKFVNHLQHLENGDLILSSGEGLVFPQGFVIGKIAKFNKDKVEYDVQVQLPLNLQDIKYCQLIKK